jgi:hypothetical protein
MKTVWTVEDVTHPWGDYFSVLSHGMCLSAPGAEELLLARTGPFVPPVTLLTAGRMVVVDRVKQVIEESGFGVLTKPVRVVKAVRLNWHQWDWGDRKPRYTPESGEPEDYIEQGQHDRNLLVEMGCLWWVAPRATGGSPGPASGRDHFWHIDGTWRVGLSKELHSLIQPFLAPACRSRRVRTRRH